MNLKFLKLLSVCLTLELIAICGVAQASWDAPTVAPPSGNRPRPLNVSDLPQEKTGALILSNTTNGLIMRDQSPLVFGNPVGFVVGFKASTTAPTSDVIWTLPITDGTNGSVLKTDGAGHLAWYNLIDLTTQDEDFGYKKNADNSINSLGTKFFTRFLNSGNIDLNMVLTGEANPSKFTGGMGDVFIENRLEVDGLSYLNNVLHVERSGGNAEIQLQSVTGANNHWGLYVDSGTNDLRFWQGANQVTFTNTGRVGVGTTTPAQAIEILGGLKLSGLIFDGNNNTGSSGQLLSSNGSNVRWIDPTWWTGSGYIYSTQNTRIGNAGTIDQANGVGDLYVQNKLEVDGNAYLKNITASSLDLNFPTGVVPFQGTTSLAYDVNNFFWDNTNKRLGIGTNTPNSKLHVYNTTQNAEIDLQSNAGAGNHWAIYNDSTSNELRFWKGAQNQFRIGSSGKVGINLGSDSFLASEPFYIDSAGDIGPHANDTYNLGSATTRWKTVFANGLDLGFPTGAVPFQGTSGLAYNLNGLFWNNTTKHLGIGTSIPTDFSLQVAGHVGPNINNQSDLGSSSKRWRNIFGTNLDLTGTLNLGFATGSVIFQGASGLAENNSKFFWDKTNDRLGLGTTTPAQILDINGNINLANTTFNKTAGVLYLGGDVFMHNSAKSYIADPNYTVDYYSNTYIGRDAGSFPATVNDEISFYDNSAVGFWALKNNQADSNTAIGSRVLFNNTSGWGNSALGVFALTNNTTGILNSAVGYYALSSNVSGGNNTAFGSNALAANLASNNTAFGNSSLSANTSGTHNTAVGIGAGQSNSTGYENLFLGDGSGDSNSVGNKNIYAGYLAGHLHASGDENVFLGYNAGYGNTSGNGTVAIGSGAGHNGSGNGNVFLGNKAGWYETGSYKLYIDSADRDADSALIYGKFYSTGDPNPMLRFNGRVGISPIGTASFAPNSSLHIYDPSGVNNAEIDIQSVTGGNNHWGIYQDRTDTDLKFWSNTSNRVIFSDGGQVAIGGVIDTTRLLRVYGDLSATNYWSADNNLQGGSAYVCMMTSASTATKVRYEDGLYICSCAPSGNNCAGTCTCP